jgi:hypothetical protein
LSETVTKIYIRGPLNVIEELRQIIGRKTTNNAAVANI